MLSVSLGVKNKLRSREEETMNYQINLIKNAMIRAGVWTEESPESVKSYKDSPTINLWHSIQCIHLPLRRDGTISQPEYLAPRLSNYIDTESEHQDILKLVIELDSISPTIEKK